MKRGWVVTEEQSIRDFLLKKAGFSRQIYKTIKKEGKALVNGKVVDELWRQLKHGDRLEIEFPEEKRGNIKPIVGELSIVYEDEDLLILNKPSGIPVIPSIDKQEPSIANYLLGYYNQMGFPYTVHIVTRLDRQTSGLMVVAKHALSHHLLTKQEKQIERTYVALVEGKLNQEQGIIDFPIKRMEGSIIRRTTGEGGKPSLTEYQVLDSGDGWTKVKLLLKTGRTHQIRVHMAAMGNPLFGDTLYGGRGIEGLDGQALHCYSIRLTHPWTKESHSFEIQEPNEWDCLTYHS